MQVESGIEKGSILAIFTLKGEAVALGKALVSTEEMLDLKHGAVAGFGASVDAEGHLPEGLEKR